MNIDILNLIIDIYYSVFNTAIVDADKMRITNTECTEQFDSLSDMSKYMLTEISLGIDNILWG